MPVRRAVMYGRTEYVVEALIGMSQQVIADINRERGEPGRLTLAWGIRADFKSHRSPNPTCGATSPENGDTWIQYRDDPNSNSFPPIPATGAPHTPDGPRWRGDCFHPNDQGHQAYSRRVMAAARALGFDGTAPPRILANPSVVPAETTAVVTWRTDVPSSSVVEYGTTAALGQRAEGPGGVTRHRVEVTGLPRGTRHFFRAVSSSAGGTRISSQSSFWTTMTCPTPDQRFCNGSCVDTTSDVRNCGTCSVRCTGRCVDPESGAQSPKVCLNGLCTCFDGPEQCEGGTTPCGGRCVDTRSDANNCGTCGTLCTDGKPCQNSTCGCPHGRVECDGDCVDPQSDNAHCGRCGNRCGPGLVCCRGACVDIQTDPAHCGACGSVCLAGQLCRDRSCTCPADRSTYCAGVRACVNTDTDRDHCGGCGRNCHNNECRAGDCGCATIGETCELGFDCCSGNCSGAVDRPGVCRESLCQRGTKLCNSRFIPVANCCGNFDCTGGQTCQSGSCACPSNRRDCGGVCRECCDNNHCTGGMTCQNGTCLCPSGRRDCGGTCVDTQTDPNHCGGCSLQCANGTACQSGRCAGGCPVGLTACGSLCVDLMWDRNHCGGCNQRCTCPRNQPGFCDGGSCDTSCGQ